MSRLEINKNLKRLSPLKFQKWFERHWKDEDWKKHYKAIGGVIPKKKSPNGE